jgi:glucose-6-phosphate isomerase
MEKVVDIFCDDCSTWDELNLITNVMQKRIKVDLTHTANFINKNELLSYQSKAVEKNYLIQDKRGEGNDFLGWLTLPSDIKSSLDKIAEAGEKKYGHN